MQTNQINNKNFHKLNNAAIAFGTALVIFSSTLASLYRSNHPVKSWIFTGVTFANTAALGAWVWVKSKSKGE